MYVSRENVLRRGGEQGSSTLFPGLHVVGPDPVGMSEASSGLSAVSCSDRRGSTVKRVMDCAPSGSCRSPLIPGTSFHELMESEASPPRALRSALDAPGEGATSALEGPTASPQKPAPSWPLCPPCLCPAPRFLSSLLAVQSLPVPHVCVCASVCVCACTETGDRVKLFGEGEQNDPRTMEQKAT